MPHVDENKNVPKDWATAPRLDYVGCEDGAAKKTSLHANQLAKVCSRVFSVEITRPDGTQVMIDPSGTKSNIKLYFLGGTDDPAIQLELKPIVTTFQVVENKSEPAADAITFHFSALSQGPHQMSYDRVPIPADVDHPRDGSYSFSDSLRAASVTLDPICSPRRMTLSFEYYEAIAFNLDLPRDNWGPEVTDLVDSFCQLQRADEGLVWFSFQKVKIVAQQSSRQLSRWRHLLSVPTNLRTYWRYARLIDTPGATVSMSPLTMPPLSSDDTWELDGERPANWVSTSSHALNSAKGRIVSVRAKTAFSHVREIETYIKGSMINELIHDSDTVTRVFNGEWDSVTYRASTYVANAARNAWITLAVIKVPKECDTALPQPGSSVSLGWKLGCDDQDETREWWSGTVLNSPEVISRQWNIMMFSHSPVVSSADTRQRPFLKFDIEGMAGDRAVRRWDWIFFGEPNHGIPRDNWLRGMLMARNNYAQLPDRSLVSCHSPMFDSWLQSYLRPLQFANESQVQAVMVSLLQRLTSIKGPPGTGKTMVAAHIAHAAYMAGKNVMMCGPSNVSVEQLLGKVVSLFKQQNLPLTGIHWHRRARDQSWTGDWSSALFQEEDASQDNPLVKFIKGQIKEEVVGVGHPQSLKSTILRNLEILRRTGWQQGWLDDQEFHYLLPLRELIEGDDDTDVWTNYASDFLEGDQSLVLYQDAQPANDLPVFMQELRDRIKERARISTEDEAEGSQELLPVTNHPEAPQWTSIPKFRNKNKELAKSWKDAERFYASSRTRVGLSTLGSILSKSIQDMPVHVLIIDEIGNVPEVLAVAAMATFFRTLTHIVLIGDTNQLPPVVTSVNRNAFAQQAKISLQERLELTGVNSIILNTQYRMDPEISDIVIGHCYTEFGRQLLLNDESTKNRPERNEIIPWAQRSGFWNTAVNSVSLFVSVTDSTLLLQAWGTSKANLQQAIAVVRIVKSLLAVFLPQDIIVIYMYTAQVGVVRSLLRSQGVEIGMKATDKKLMVKTVDGTQGIEAKIVVVDLVTPAKEKWDSGFLGELPRLNVAFSRARACRIVVGHHLMGKNERSRGGKFMADYARTHRNRQANMDIGNDILTYETAFRGGSFILAHMKEEGVSATKLFDKFRR